MADTLAPGAAPLEFPSNPTLRVASEIALAAIIVVLVALILFVIVRHVRYRMYLSRVEDAAALRRGRGGEAGEEGVEEGATPSEHHVGINMEGFVNLEPPRRTGLSKAVIESLGSVFEYKDPKTETSQGGAPAKPPVHRPYTGADAMDAGVPGGDTVSSSPGAVLESARALELSTSSLLRQDPEAQHEDSEGGRGAGGEEREAGGERKVAVRECAVCLCEYKPKERLRWLHKCAHHFHQDCIDAWLQTNATCPLCRTLLVPEKAPAPPVPTPLSEPPAPRAPPPPTAVVGQNGITMASVERPHGHHQHDHSHSHSHGGSHTHQQHHQHHRQQEQEPLRRQQQLSVFSSSFPSGLVIGSVAAPPLPPPRQAAASGTPAAERSLLLSATQWSLFRAPFMPFQGST